MKKIIIAAGLLATMTGAVATAATLRPVDYRRTLFAPLGQDTLMLEAPKGMCFLDTTRYLESAIYKVMADIERKKGAGVLIGVFAPCAGIANIGNGDDGNGVMSSGAVIWLNPSIGEKTPLERNDYLDMREATYKDDIKKRIASEHSDKSVDAAADYAFDEVLRRTDNGLSLGFVHDMELEFNKIQTISIAATTSIRHYPIEVILHINSKTDDYSLAQTHELMDKFLAQQVTLNE